MDSRARAGRRAFARDIRHSILSRLGECLRHSNRDAPCSDHQECDHPFGRRPDYSVPATHADYGALGPVSRSPPKACILSIENLTLRNRELTHHSEQKQAEARAWGTASFARIHLTITQR